MARMTLLLFSVESLALLVRFGGEIESILLH
jgi:hypothetical protein